MTNVDLLLVLMGPVGGFVTGMVIFLIARRQQRRFFAAHPEYPDPFERRTPAE